MEPTETSAEGPSKGALLVACTDEARSALNGDASVRIERFPCNVGRESRTARAKQVMSVERQMGVVPPLNDLFLKQDSSRRYVSREHFRISFVQGRYVLTDRGSTLGTTVNGVTIGGRRSGGHVDLHHGDQIGVGDTASPIVFEFRVE